MTLCVDEEICLSILQFLSQGEYANSALSKDESIANYIITIMH